MRAVVIGAGIIGGSVAYQLARQGVDVVVVDGGLPQATAQSFGWINASFYHDAAHHRLRVAGIEAYARLLGDLPDVPVSICGALWWEHQGTKMDRMQAHLVELGYPVRRLTQAQAHSLAPDVAGLPQAVLHFPSEGAADSGALAALLLERARALGARVMVGDAVLGIETLGGCVSGVRTGTGKIDADQVIVAAGTGAPAILASVGVHLPMLTRPGAIVVSAPVPARIGPVLVTPEGEVRQLPDGRLMSPASANHQSDSAEAIPEPLASIAERTCVRLARLVGLDHLDWSDVGIGHRPVPVGGLPAIGPAGPSGLTIAVMHSGVTLAAITGEVVAGMVTKRASNAHAALLAPYDPNRFSAG